MAEFDRRVVETWLRRRGLPLMVRRDMRGTALLQRSTPALVFLLAIDPLLSLLAALLDVTEEEFERLVNNPAFVFALLALAATALVLPVLAGWLTSKWMAALDRSGRIVLAGTALVLNVVILPLVDWGTGLRSVLWVSLTINVASTLLVLFAVYAGAGSILAWGLRSAVRQLGTVGTMATKALPLLVLVVLFAFFSTEMWQIASALPRWRLWLVVGLLAGLAVLFMAASLGEELRDMAKRASSGMIVDLPGKLRGTPLAGLVADGEPVDPQPLSKAERANITLVLFLAQALQIAILAVLVFGVFLVFGALAIDNEVVISWVGEEVAAEPGSLFNLRLPVSQALVQVSMFVAVFSGLYFTASAATDPHYRKSFFDPLLVDVRVSLAVRQVYLAHRGREA